MFNGTWLYAEHGKIISKGAVGAITKVGPTTSPVDGGHVSDHVGEHVSEHVEGAPLFIHLEPEKYDALMRFCEQPRSRAELQVFCEIKSRVYFSEKILQPLLKSERLKMTVPEKPKSTKQKYVKP